MITNHITKNLDRSSLISLANTSEQHNFLIKELLIKKILIIATTTINLSQFKQGCSEHFENDFNFLNRKFIESLSSKPIDILYDLSQMQGSQIFTELNSSYKQIISQRESSYERITRNLPACIQFGKKELPKEYDDEVLSLLEKGNWQAFATHDPEQFAYQVLALFRENKITSSQFATSMFYWALRRDFSYESLAIIPLFHENGINPIAFRIIEQTFASSHRLKFICNKENLDQLFHAMESQPESEKHLFIIKNYNLHNKLRSPTISQVVQRLGHNMFHEFYHPEKIPIVDNINKNIKECAIEIERLEIKKKNIVSDTGYLSDKIYHLRTKLDELNDELKKIKTQTSRMCVPLTIHQQFLNICFGKHAITLSPIIGTSTLNDIANNSIYSTRDVGIPFPVNFQDFLLNSSDLVDEQPLESVDEEYPLSKIPDSADGYAAPTYLDFWLHDTTFHGVMASMVPHEDQKKFYQLACLLEHSDTTNDSLALFNQKLISRLIDMECTAYITYIHFINTNYIKVKNNIIELNDEEKRMLSFLHALELHIQATTNNLVTQLGLNQQEVELMIKNEGWLVNIIKQCIESGILPKTLDPKITSLLMPQNNSSIFLFHYLKCI